MAACERVANSVTGHRRHRCVFRARGSEGAEPPRLVWLFVDRDDVSGYRAGTRGASRRGGRAKRGSRGRDVVEESDVQPTQGTCFSDEGAAQVLRPLAPVELDLRAAGPDAVQRGPGRKPDRQGDPRCQKLSLVVTARRRAGRVERDGDERVKAVAAREIGRDEPPDEVAELGRERALAGVLETVDGEAQWAFVSSSATNAKGRRQQAGGRLQQATALTAEPLARGAAPGAPRRDQDVAGRT